MIVLNETDLTENIREHHSLNEVNDVCYVKENTGRPSSQDNTISPTTLESFTLEQRKQANEKSLLRTQCFTEIVEHKDNCARKNGIILPEIKSNNETANEGRLQHNHSQKAVLDPSNSH